MSDLAAFFAISVLVIVTPGQDTALTIRNTLLGGRRGGIATAVGVANGQAIRALAASIGVAALLQASEPAFLAIKLAGAGYLIFLGLHSLRAGLRRAAGATGPAEQDEGHPRLAASRAYRQGVLGNLGNPKMAIFFTSLLPQFVDQRHSAFLPLLLLGLVFCAMTFTWLTGYAAAVAKASRFLHRPRIRRLLDTVTGAALVALGLRLAAE